MKPAQVEVSTQGQGKKPGPAMVQPHLVPLGALEHEWQRRAAPPRGRGLGIILPLARLPHGMGMGSQSWLQEAITAAEGDSPEEGAALNHERLG